MPFMSMILQVDAWKLGLIFFVLMLAAGWAGTRVRAIAVKKQQNENTRIADASIALFALLLAFSFSGAAERYENRKEYLLDEAIAIGDFAATTSMLENPERDQIRQELVGYVKERLAFGKVRIEAPEMQALTARSRERQEHIQSILHRVFAEKKSSTLHTPLMNGFNGMTMTHDKALYGSRNQISDTIIVLLITFGLISAFMTGRFGGSSDESSLTSSMTWLALYTLLVTSVFVVTMDLEQPHRGIMRSSKLPLTDLLISLEHPALEAKLAREPR